MIDYIAVNNGICSYYMIYSLPQNISTFCYPQISSCFFYEYNYNIYIENKHTPGYLLLQQYHESIIYISDPLNLTPCELDLTSTLFYDTTTITYVIELPPAGK